MGTSEPPPHLPWSTDRELDAGIAARHLASVAPDLAIDWLTWVGRGWDADVWRAGPLAFRFPRRRDAHGGSPWEDRLLVELAPALTGLGVRVPTPLRTLPPSEHFPYPVAVRGWVEGRAAPTGPGRLPLDALRTLGRALGVVHALPVARALELGVPTEQWILADRVAETEADLPRLRASEWGTHPLIEASVRAFEEVAREVAAVGPAAAPTAPIHGDLVADHVLLDTGASDSEDAALVGLIDWADASIGDPADDFLAIAAEWGDEGLDATLGAYGRGSDAAFRRRVVLAARATVLHWMHDDLLEGLDPGPALRRIRTVLDLRA